MFQFKKTFLNFYVYYQLKKLLHSYPFKAAEVKKIQHKKLKELLYHSYNNIPFYKKRMDDAGFHPDAFKHIDDLQKIPPLSKEEYRKYTEEMVSSDAEKYASYYHDSTSGSSGTPLHLYRTWSERSYLLAKWLREAYLNGYQYSDKTFRMVSPHRLHARDSIVQKLGFFQRDVVSYLAPVQDKINAYLKSNPDFFYGNKTQILQLAIEIQKQGINVPAPKMYAVGAEILDKNSMAIIKDVFGTDNFFEIYGCEELGALAWQQLGDDVLQFSHDTNILELDNKGVIDKQCGHCLITDLHIKSFPLIRYELGDWLEVEEREGLAVIKKITGRKNDWLVWKDGTSSDYHSFYELMATQTDTISQFRIIQESYELVRILVVINPGVSKEIVIQELLTDAKEMVRDDVEYVVDVKENILPDPSGKLRMIISKVYDESLESSVSL